MANQSQRAEYIHRWQRAGARRSPASERDVGVMVLSWTRTPAPRTTSHPPSFFLPSAMDDDHRPCAAFLCWQIGLCMSMVPVYLYRG